MKNKRGFTLVELLAVIVILIIVTLLAVPAVLKMLNVNRGKSYDAKVKIILKQAKQFARENSSFLYDSEKRYLGKVCNIVTVGQLRSTGFLKEITSSGSDSVHIINPDTGESMDDLEVVVIINSNNLEDNVEKYSGPLISTLDYVTLCTSSNQYPTTNFDYTGAEQVFTATEDGYYKLQVWGAQGGWNIGSNGGAEKAGKGGYGQGLIYLTQGEKLYIYIGGQGATCDSSSCTGVGGWNGGGQGMYGGGGATDIRVEGNTLYHRILVAGGGGSSCENSLWCSGCVGGAGGGTLGRGCNWCSSQGTSGGAQTPGSNPNAGFGYGENARTQYGGGINGSGGGGWYGGDAGSGDNSMTGMAHSCGSGGSGFAYDGTNPVLPEGYAVTNHTLLKAKLIAGDSKFMPTHGGAVYMEGNEGNGYAVITFLGDDI